MESSCLAGAVLHLRISSMHCRDNSLNRANASSDTGLRFKSGSADQREPTNCMKIYVTIGTEVINLNDTKVKHVL